MKDIDFDELDRAVGSVLGADNKADDASKTDTPATAVATVSPKPPTISEPAATEPDNAVEQPKVNEEEKSVVTPEIKPSVSPARKRGQFLDMVHPSADMRKAPKMQATARKTLAPLNAVVAPEEPVSKPATEVEVPSVDAVVPEPATPDVIASQESSQNPAPANQETPKEEWPDPLDFAKESAEVSATAQEPTLLDNAEPTVVEASQTPFVADAKVDKRPLGAFASHDEASTEALVESSDDTLEFNPEVNSIESTGVPQAEDEATGLTGEVPAVEALSEDSPVVPPSASEADSTVETGSLPDEVTPAEQEAKPELSKVEETKVETPAPVAPVASQTPSIPQQYKTAEAPKEDNDAHPLFDTEEYHQPLLADGKKKSSKIILIIVMLVILLALGGALGYIAYNVGI